MKNKELMVRRESIFTKIKNFFYKLFYKKSIELDTNVNTQQYANLYGKTEINKEKSLKIYSDLKSGQIRTEDIPNDYLEVIKEFLMREIEIKENKLKSMQMDISENKYTIKAYQEQIKKLQA